MKQGLIYSFTIFLLGLIAYIFWWQEIQYTLPTPIPNNYTPVLTNTKPILTDNQLFSFEKPVFIHFFNPHCPCSKFNLEHIKYLVKTYQKDVNFYVVMSVEEDETLVTSFKESFGLPISIYFDKNKQLATSLGVYSTPQAVILDKSSMLYFRGNYNKTRYCTDKKTNFAEIAIQNLLEGKIAPIFPIIATQSYGCELPTNESIN
jgi:thiol-disulfide isomerase/thioredoxin